MFFGKIYVQNDEIGYHVNHDLNEWIKNELHAYEQKAKDFCQRWQQMLSTLKKFHFLSCFNFW